MVPFSYLAALFSLEFLLFALFISCLSSGLLASSSFSFQDIWMCQALHQRHLPATASGTHFPALAAGLPGLSCPGSALPLTWGGPLSSCCWASVPHPGSSSLLVYACALGHVGQLLLEEGVTGG